MRKRNRAFGPKVLLVQVTAAQMEVAFYWNMTFFNFLLSRNCDILSRDDVSWRWRRSRCSFTKSVLAVAYELRFSQCFSIILASVATLTFLTSNVSSPFLGFLSHVCSFPISIVIAPQILTNHFLNISFSSLYLCIWYDKTQAGGRRAVREAESFCNGVVFTRWVNRAFDQKDFPLYPLVVDFVVFFLQISSSGGCCLLSWGAILSSIDIILNREAIIIKQMYFLKVWHFPPQIYTLFCRILSGQTFTHFLWNPSKKISVWK